GLLQQVFLPEAFPAGRLDFDDLAWTMVRIEGKVGGVAAAEAVVLWGVRVGADVVAAVEVAEVDAAAVGQARRLARCVGDVAGPVLEAGADARGDVDEGHVATSTDGFGLPGKPQRSTRRR